MKITKELLEKYASGLCSPDEVSAIEAWLSTPQAETSFPTDFNHETHKSVIWEAINEKLPAQPVDNAVPLWSYVRLGRWLVAAILIIAIGLSFWAYKDLMPSDLELGQFSQHRLIRTKLGQKTRIRLNDGTLVYLNSGSELRFPVSFKDSIREIHLKGEAFLQVAKDPTHPFVVRTATANVRVLGTQFNVYAFPNEESAVVVVKEGKVFLSLREDRISGVILTGGQSGIIKKDSITKQPNVYNRRYLEWKDNNLVFDNQRIDEIARLLHRWYGVEIQLGSGQIASQRFTGEFASQPVEYVVEKLCYVLDLKYKMREKKILIY